jgi:hypothetical protein
VAGLLLTTECIITELPEGKASCAHPGAGGMGGGMGDMM